MSSCDDTENQCERRNEACGAAMGDVLAKGYYSEEKSESCSETRPKHSQDDLRIISEGQDTGSFSKPEDSFSSSRNGCAPAEADMRLDSNPLKDIKFVDTALRIEEATKKQIRRRPPMKQTSEEANARGTEHSTKCPSKDSQDSINSDSVCQSNMRKLCKLKRVMRDDELKHMRWHGYWDVLKNHIRSVFDAALEASAVTSTEHYESILREYVIDMCRINSQQLLLVLIVQAQEFVAELKNRIKETLNDQSLTNVAEVFLTRILDGYDAFVSTAKLVADLVKPVEERYLLKFNLTWEFFNKALYENHIWMSEPSMRNVTGSFTTQLTKSRKRHSYQALFERYVAFVEEMMRVAELWPETERLIVKWSDKQTNKRGRAASTALDSSNVTSTSEKYEKPVESKTLDDEKTGSNACENSTCRSNNHVSSPRLSNGLSVNASTETNFVDSSPSISPTYGVEESTIRQDCNNALREIASDLSESLERRSQRQMCQCIYEHLREIDGRGWRSDLPCLCVLNLRWLCGVSLACPCLVAAPTKEATMNERPESPTSTTCSPVTPRQMSNASEGSTTNSRFCQSVQKQTRHSTTQTTSQEPATAIIPAEADVAVTTVSSTTSPLHNRQSATHNHNPSAPHQGRCSSHSHFHGTTPDLAKNTGPIRRAIAHNNHASHACHKQAKVEHIKRVLCNDLSPGDGDCSDSGSSHEDSSSTSSSTPRDSNRHCDCCYCEVFGPGVPSVAPVSRNYNEMRERLRQLLTKKKAKKCKTPCSPPKSPAESPVAPNASADKKPACPTRPPVPRTNTPIPVVPPVQPEQQDERDLEALLEFIEGNQGTKKDNKKTEKKARQKQRKLEELLMKAKAEAERQKLVQLQKKTPEVTITVVDPQKPVFQRLMPQRNLPEVSILPATAPRVSALGALKQACKNSNIKKKDKHQQQQQQQEIGESLSVANASKAKTAMISVTPINLNVFDFVVRESVVSKRISKSDATSKNEKAAVSKNGKAQPAVTPNQPDANVADVKLTKKERKRLRRQMKSLEEEKAKEPEQRAAPPQAENQPQIVTIKRVMESNSAEPTVTITLKGQTPADDKVLFTLINGQTKELGSAKSEQQQQQGQASGGKKKKGKKNSGNNNQNNQNVNQAQQQAAKGQQQNTAASAKSQTGGKANDGKLGKQQQQQQPSNEKSKGKKAEEKKAQQPQPQIIPETKSTKSKKEQKNANAKQAVAQQASNSAKNKNAQQQQNSGKKQNSVNTSQQNQGAQKSQQSQNIANESSGKKTKGQDKPAQDKNSLGISSNKKKSAESSINKQQSVKIENQKNRTKNNQAPAKQQQQTNCYISNDSSERNVSALSSQLKDVTMSSKINIENLKLPPGITITKVDAPAKPLPIKSAPIPKPVTVSKQTTIIAAPMSGVQSSYAGSQSGGNVIVVDTGKLKQDLLPKNSGDKDTLGEFQSGDNATAGKKKNKKKKKGKMTANSGSASGATNGSSRGGNDSGKENGDEPARILHNPGSNMVTIRNPAFGPPPKIDATPQAAIIKVSENGMVTIRSPALQQAINAGLTPPPKPDFIVRGDPSKGSSNAAAAAAPPSTGRTTLTPSNSLNHNNTNGIISSSFAELRSRLTPDCTGISGLANIHISKVTNGQPIPESGINLKGTSVTLTKVRSPEVSSAINSTNAEQEVQRTKSAVSEAISATMQAPASGGKSKKKKKRGTGARHCGDDWNLVESVFTPKDIDLEDGEMDDAERELEAFKRFCQQSVPPPRKEKVNLNIKDIVLKKKCSSSSSAAGAAIAAN